MIGCKNNFGIITQNTVINLNEILTLNKITKVKISPIFPSRIDPQIFNSVLAPHFTSRPRHLNKNQYLYLNQMEYVITGIVPINGIVDKDTEFFFEGPPLYPVQAVSFTCFIEDIPLVYLRISRAGLHHELLQCFLLPYFQGTKKLISQNQAININGLEFIVSGCTPDSGLIMEHTMIYIDGNFVSRDPYQNTQIELRNRIASQQIAGFDFVLAELETMIQRTNARPRCTPDELIQSLPIREIEPNDQSQQCVVCLSEFEPKEKVKYLPCFHNFHCECIDRWLTKNNVCPLCKFKIE